MKVRGVQVLFRGVEHWISGTELMYVVPVWSCVDCRLSEREKSTTPDAQPPNDSDEMNDEEIDDTDDEIEDDPEDWDQSLAEMLASMKAELTGDRLLTIHNDIKCRYISLNIYV